MKRGHIVYVPHISHFFHTHPNCDREWPWYTFDNSFLDHWAEALFFIAPSFGANNEKVRAEKLGLKIYTKMVDVPIGHDLDAC